MAWACADPAVGQVEPTPEPDLPNVERSLATLEGLARSLAEATDERNELLDEAAKPGIGEDRLQEIETLVEFERERIRQLRDRFRDLVGGAEAAEFDASEEPETTLQDQVSEVVKPILSALQEPTSRLREMEDMRAARDMWRERRDKCDTVLARITALETANRAEQGNQADEANARVAAELEAARRQWEARRSQASGQFEVLTLQIDERERNTPTFWQSITAMIGDFIKNRGLNLLLAVVAGAAAFILTRKGYLWIRRVSPVHHWQGGTLLGRASDLIAFTAAILVSVASVLGVLFARGDWLLLTVAAILLFGALWAGKTALPPYIEQVRLLLNLGAVREDERIIYRGLPWRIESLGFYTIFENPALHGGRMRIPLREVLGMISRKARADEPWFPSQKGDWLLLSDGTHGQVEHQTPEQVVLRRRGDSLKTYRTEEFLELAPENLAPGFRVREIFGIDYAHQAICTTEVPGVFRDAVEQAMVSEFGIDAVRAVMVEFQAASSSSLDFAVKVDLTHAAAARHRFIPRLIQRACVDACNERGWTIPFTQITLHQA